MLYFATLMSWIATLIAGWLRHFATIIHYHYMILVISPPQASRSASMMPCAYATLRRHERRTVLQRLRQAARLRRRPLQIFASQPDELSPLLFRFVTR